MGIRARRAAAAIAAALAVVIVVDLLEVVRPSPVAAVACTALLVKPGESASAFLNRYQDEIRGTSATYDLPASLVAAVVADHLRQQTAFRDFTDCAGSALGANLSLGPGQIRMSTAAALQRRSFANLSGPAYRELRRRLMTPEENLDFTAKELRALLERRNRYPGITSTELMRQPHAMALAVSEYRMGRSSAPRDSAKLGINAFGTLSLMQGGELDYLENGTNLALERAHITEYLRYIHCESGIFNERACSDWTKRQAADPPAVPALPPRP